MRLRSYPHMKNWTYMTALKCSKRHTSKVLKFSMTAVFKSSDKNENHKALQTESQIHNLIALSYKLRIQINVRTWKFETSQTFSGKDFGN